MRKSIKNFFLAGLLLMASLQFAQAFSFSGPGIGGGAGGDSWEKPIIGYGLTGGPYGADISTPKNIGEGFRRVTPVMYYAMDASFLDFFGLAGTTNIDIAFAMMNGAMCGQTNSVLFLNSPTNGIISGFSSDPYTGTPLVLRDLDNLNTYTTDLADFPLESQQINFTAQTLGMTDLKSETLELLVEQMGLTTPERYAWTLHDRFLPPGGKCPGDDLYLVVQRNFDFINSPLNQVQYSPYINGTLYGYIIEEFCQPNQSPYVTGNEAITVPVAVDVFADVFTAVASFTLLPGGFYTSLTRDDVGGLRYLYGTNNISYEATVPSGGRLIATNTTPPQTFGPTLSLAQLFLDAQISDPNTLQALYPGLNFISVGTNLVNLVNTNLSLFFTNLPPPYTNRVALSNGAAVYGPNGTVPFTNWSPVQYGDPPIQVTTLPLGPLLTLAPFTDPATLIGLYPGLLVDHVITNSFGVAVTTNIVPFFTNQSVMPYFSNNANGVKLPITTALTNIYYFTNQPGPTIVNFDTHSFLTITTLDLATFADAAVTNDPVTLQALYPGLQIVSFSAFPKTLFVTNFISYLTNYSGAPFSSPPKAVTRAISTNAFFGTVYSYQFGNVFTNHSHTNRYIRTRSIWLTNFIGAPVGSPSFTVTNDVFTKVPMVAGDFFIYPTNWCGFDLLLDVNPNPPNSFGPTNESDFQGYTSTSGQTFGLTNFISDVYTNYIIAVRPGICEPVLAFGTTYTTNIVNQFQYDFINVVTNHYFTNTFVTIITTNISFTNSGLTTNVFSKSFYTNLPSGDFFIIPTTWCGFQILGLLTNTIANTAQTLGTNAVDPSGVQFSQTLISEYTNYTFSIRPGICEPALSSSTNYTTNTVFQYNYYFSNIITNHYFTNGPVIVITTNLAIFTNGLAGTLTNIVTVVTNNNGVGGDFYIIPPNLCGFTILGVQSTAVIATTNFIQATNLPGVPNVGQMYSVTSISTYTNSIFQVQESTCSTVAAPPALREGIGRVVFIRKNFDSLLGRVFQPLTNFYTMTMVTNSQPVKEYYQRIVTAPDFLIQAQDLTAGPTGPTAVGSVARNLNFDSSTITGGLAGPGTITPGTTFTYNKVGTVYNNGSPNLFLLATNAFLSQLTQGSGININGQGDGLSVITWASFDFSTNDPVVYPSGTSIANLFNQLYLQVSPTVVPAGTNGVAYTPVVFTATGGQQPYTWAAPNLSGLVPGLTFNASTQTLSGTPSATGTFNFIIQLTDAVNRQVNLNYSIIIH